MKTTRLVMKQLGLATLVAAGLTLLPFKTSADIYVFDFQGALNQVYNNQTINGLSLGSGTFVDVSFSIDAATPGTISPLGGTYYDPSAITSITLSNSSGVTTVLGTYGTEFHVNKTQVEFVTYRADAPLNRIVDWQLNISGTSDNTFTLASGFQLLENNSLTNTYLQLFVTDLGWNVASTSVGTVTSMSYSITPVPEPSFFALGAVAIASLWTYRRRTT
jgi:hypothetical protein